MIKYLVSRWIAILWQGGGSAPSCTSVDGPTSDAGSPGHHKPATFDDYNGPLNWHPDLQSHLGWWDASNWIPLAAERIANLEAERDLFKREMVALAKDALAGKDALDQERADNERLRAAAKVADWEQVRLNGGPPCFHIEDGRFCFRAERWPGHPTYHKYVTLHTALLSGRGEDTSNG